MNKELREKLWSELLNYFEILDSKWRGMDWFLDCVEQEIIEAERLVKNEMLEWITKNRDTVTLVQIEEYLATSSLK